MGTLKNPLPLFFLSIVAAVESVWILLSDGFYPVDECAHFLYSRFVLSSLHVTVETWHRPGLLWLCALPAQIGHTCTMFFLLAVFLTLLYVTYRIAVSMNIRHAAWVILLTGFQPVLFNISYACLAEAPAALLLALSFLCLLKGRYGWSLATASAVFLFRFEMYAFALAVFALAARKREWRILPLLALGPLLWIAYSAVISGDAVTFFREWSAYTRLGKYVQGIPVMYYVQHLHAIYGIAQVLLFAAGVVSAVRGRPAGMYWMLFGAIAFDIIINTLAGAEVFHWTGSIGESRYIAVVGPFVGIVAARGFSGVLERVRGVWGGQALSLLIMAVTIVQCTVSSPPRRWANYDRIVIAMTRALEEGHPDRTLLCNNYVPAYVMDVSPSGGPRFARLNSETLARHPRSMILWDPFSSNPLFFPTGVTKESLFRDSANVVVDRDSYGGAEYVAFLRDASRVNVGR